MIVLRLAVQSLLNRRFTVLLTVISIAFSVLLLLGVEKIRTGTKESFRQTISGTDLIVGARASGMQLLLYSVFHIGNPTNNVSWETIEDLKKRPEVDWLVPISLGDSYRGHRVVGTDPEYFERFQYRKREQLKFQEGKPMGLLFEAVAGSEVARKFGHQVGDEIVIGHGGGEVSFVEHGQYPFRLVGILERTGTPVDRSMFVSLESLEAIHSNWQAGVPTEKQVFDESDLEDLQPSSVTAAYISVKSPLMSFGFQRFANTYKEEPITAILPVTVLAELWLISGNVELALIAISSMVVVTAVLGLIISILSTLNERRREMAILRSIGARPGHIFALFTAEAALIAAAGALLGLVVTYGVLALALPAIERGLGLYIPMGLPSAQEWSYLGAIFAGGLLAGCIPALRAYRLSLSDGLAVRV